MRKKIIHTLIILVAIVFIIIGLLGTVLPLLPGIVLVVMGLYLISFESRPVHNTIQKIIAPYPKLKKHLDAFDTKLRHFLNKLLRSE